MKSDAFKILYALLQNPLCASENDIFQWWVEKIKSEAFKILYEHLKMISFNDGMLEKWNLKVFKILYALL